MCFTEEQINSTLYYLIFETINQDLILLSKKYGLSDEEIGYVNWNYNPAIKINIYSESEITQFLNIKKKKFIENVGVFEIDTFTDFNNIDYKTFVDNINLVIEIIDRGKAREEFFENNIPFLCFKYPSDHKMTLFLTEKNLTQLKVYFKILIKTVHRILNEFSEEVIFPRAYEKESLYKALIETTKQTNLYHFKKNKVKETNVSVKPSSSNSGRGIKLKIQYSKLPKLREGLIDNKLIDYVDLPQFREVFLGENKITNKINWIGNKNEIWAFIDVLSKEELFESKDDKWISVSNCFKHKGSNITNIQIGKANRISGKKYGKISSIVNSVK